MTDNENGLPEGLVPHPDFGDVESLYNMREWLADAIKAKGASIEGSGVGMGAADIDFKLEGHPFNVNIKPIIRT